MKLAFLSSTEGNNGPSNVHREIVSHWPDKDELLFASQRPKLFKIIDSLAKGMRANAVFSGDADWPELIACRILHILGKPIVCFNHGYVPYENAMNDLGLSKRKIDAYRRYLSEASAVVANSRHQMDFIARMRPDLVSRLSFANNGVDQFEMMLHQASSDGVIRVAVSGGTRPIKKNEVVANAVRLLNENGQKAILSVYGRGYAKNDKLSEFFDLPYITMRGQVPHNQLLRELQRVDVFVMNSAHESFGLSALDAIEAGCSLLISLNCGISRELDLAADDTIADCEDSAEIAGKIEKLFVSSNAERLYRGIDFNALSWNKTVQELRAVVENACNDMPRHN